MKKAIVLLLLTNLTTCFYLWYYKHNYETMVQLSEISEKYGQEFLLVTTFKRSNGYANVFATPTIFRSLEECVKTETEWNSDKSSTGSIWRCENYRKP